MSINSPLTPNEIKHLFEKKVFHHIDSSALDWDLLLPQIRRKQIDQKIFILNAGEKWDKLFHIRAGLVRLFYLDREGREFNKAFFAENQTIWPVAPQDRNHHVLFNIGAIEDTEVLECPIPTLYSCLKETDQWEKFALPFAEKLVEQKFLREHDFLLFSAAERLQKFSDANPHIVRRLPDYHLASFLSITHVSLSRIKRSLIVNI